MTVQSQITASLVTPVPHLARSSAAHPVVRLSLLVPCFNEQDAVEAFVARVSETLGARGDIELELLFVNDGSTDATLPKLLRMQVEDPRIRIIELTRNFGKEAALSAGLMEARGDVVVPIDVDLQHPPEVVLDMLAKWRDGFDVVVAKRVNRDDDPLLRRIFTRWFYAIQNNVGETHIPADVGDFRLMDAQVVRAVNQLPENRRFMKGLFAWVGFPTAVVEFEPHDRVAGQSRFNGYRLWNFALEGLTSFSTAPLKIWTYIGLAMAVFAFLNGLYILIRVMFVGIESPGFASIFTAVTFLGGLQLIGIGVLGEYVGRTYMEAKRRPAFLVRAVYEPDHD